MSEESPPTSQSNDDAKSVEQPRRSRKLATGLAFGIGSAAIVAALLYTNRSKSKDSDA